ncbi:MAG: PIN domain-containing protein [Bacteroidales bacterium]|nr:PIN domain-containing protein [Bacteroidales bacterium]MCQ2318063.1 PIN domain-containing protein [Bacteroidales bacterium]
MAKYLLDTNICGFLFRNKYGIKEKIKQVGLENCAVSLLTIAELMVGVEYTLQNTGVNKYENLKLFENSVTILPVEPSIEFAAKEKARLQLAGTEVNDLIDLLIAGTAYANDLTLITDNIKHFQNIKGIKIDNWVVRN